MFVSFVFKVSDLIPGVRPPPAPGPTGPSRTRAPPISHAHQPLHVRFWLHVEIKCQEKSSPPVEKGNYPQPPAFIPRAAGLGVPENTGTPLSSAKPNAKQLHGGSPASGSAGIACHLHTHLYHHQRLLATSSRGSKKQIKAVPMGACKLLSQCRFLEQSLFYRLG